MKIPFLLFDVDGTLIETSGLAPYRASEEGKKYFLSNPCEPKTSVFDNSILRICDMFGRIGRLAIVSNAYEGQIKALLSIHNFPGNIKVYGSAGKPSSAMISKALKEADASPAEALLIGDMPTDILAAHDAGIASIGASWCERKDPENMKSLEIMLEKAQPNLIISNPKELWDRIISFEKEEFGYEERIAPADYRIIEPCSAKYDEINHFSLGPYIYKKGEEITPHTRRIMDFKAARDYFMKEIKAGCAGEYFHGGRIRKGPRYKDLLNALFREVREKINSLALKGKTFVLPAPNSNPEFCYRTDINYQIANFLHASSSRGYQDEKRVISRLRHKKESHLGEGRTNADTHHKTMGIYMESKLFSADNVIIFDDMRTKGVQIKAIADVVRGAGFSGNLYSVTIGHVEGR